MIGAEMRSGTSLGKLISIAAPTGAVAGAVFWPPIVNVIPGTCDGNLSLSCAFYSAVAGSATSTAIVSIPFMPLMYLQVREFAGRAFGRTKDEAPRNGL